MTRIEFGIIAAYLSAGCGKPISTETSEVYFDLLADLPAETLQVAAKQALLESQYPSFPAVGVLRKFATAVQHWLSELPAAPEAWGLVRRAMLDYGYYRPESGIQSLPPIVRRTVECLGWREICDSGEPEIVRAQFCKAYETLAGREQRERLLPVALKQQLDQIGRLPKVEQRRLGG